MRYISNFRGPSRPFVLHRSSLAISTELEKSRLAVVDEVKFDITSDLGDHAKKYKAISRNFFCEYMLQRDHSSAISYTRSIADTLTGEKKQAPLPSQK